MPLNVDNRLSNIEEQLLQLTGCGATTQDVAKQVRLSVRSVQYLMRNITRKLTGQGDV